MNSDNKYDRNEADFHKFEAGVQASQESHGNFLAESFRKKLDSAFASIPEPLRMFIDNLAKVYELEELDLVLDLAMLEDWYAWDVEDDLPGNNSPKFTMVEIGNAWWFIKGYRAAEALLLEADSLADELLNPAGDEAQQRN